MARPEVTGRKCCAHGVSETTPHQARAPPTISGRRLLSYDDLEPRGIRFSRVHLRRLEARGLFPQHVKIGAGNFIAWLSDEIDQYLDNLAAARPARAAPKTTANTKEATTPA